MAGAFVALHAHRGLAHEFTGWMLIHGVTELGAIVIFAAAGLKLGELMLFPGRHSRVDALPCMAPRSARWLSAAYSCCWWRRCSKASFGETVVNTDQRLAIAFVTFLLWTLYFTFAGRKSRSAHE